jgi:uncharacterized protein YbbC (DUF1343 family)
MRCIVFFCITLLLTAPLQAAPVQTGAEILAESGFGLLRGKRVGVVTNQSAMVEGKHLIEQMRLAGVPPAMIFAPEHGFRGTAEDGEHLPDGNDQNIPVRSLYGATRKPQHEDLRQLDLLVFDIQDVGVRFYTYISTLGMVMEAAAEAGIPLLVLDRPNPLGGDYLAGFVRSGIRPTFTSFYPIPIAHGMTVGELAQMIVGESFLPTCKTLKLAVVPMTGWQRQMRWPDTGLRWVPPSPNLATFDAALAYAGIGLLEGTNANEGRGTPSPFQLVGIPGIDPEKLASALNSQELPGVRFSPARYTPGCIPGKESAPKYRNQELPGVRIEITDYRSLEPVETGVAVITELRSLLPEGERNRLAHGGLNDLAGTPRLRQALEEGLPAEEIAETWADEVQSFRRKRSPYLLYPEATPLPSRAIVPPRPRQRTPPPTT